MVDMLSQAHSCDFESLLEKCNKSNYETRFVWNLSDTKNLSKYLEIIITILSFIISIFGIGTNSLLIYLVFSRGNSDIFKGLNQYRYLWALSVFNISILSIQIFSWLSECKDIYDVFCPVTHRFVFFQFFKIIFKETLVVALRFMGNFAYMAFAFSRIALIGKDHPQIVKKLTDCSFTFTCSFA